MTLQTQVTLHIQTSGRYCHESSPRDWEYAGKAKLSFLPDVLPRLKSSWIYCKMPRVSRSCGQMPLETTFLFIFDDKLFISLPPLWPQSRGTCEREGKEWLLEAFILLPSGRLTQSPVEILTKVRVNRDPKKQVTTTPSTNNSRRLAQICGNSSSTAVITPSRPAN